MTHTPKLKRRTRTKIPVTILTVSIMMMIGIAPTATARQQNQKPTDSTQDHSNPLAGPKIETSAHPAGKSLSNGVLARMSPNLERHIDGSIISLGTQPDLEILKNLNLNSRQLEILNKIRIDRGLALGTAARKHYADILEFGTLASSGEFEQNKALFLQQIDRLAHAFNEYFRRGSYLTEIQPALTPAQRWNAIHMLGEYRAAQVNDRKRLNHDQRGPFEILLEIRMEEFGELIGESLQANASIDSENFQRFINLLQLNPKQISDIEAIYSEIGTQSFLGMEVSVTDQLAAYSKLHRILTPTQRAKLRREFARGNWNLDRQPLPDEKNRTPNQAILPKQILNDVAFRSYATKSTEFTDSQNESHDQTTSHALMPSPATSPAASTLASVRAPTK